MGIHAFVPCLICDSINSVGVQRAAEEKDPLAGKVPFDEAEVHLLPPRLCVINVSCWLWHQWRWFGQSAYVHPPRHVLMSVTPPAACNICLPWVGKDAGIG
eukprot:CAMPEP_0195159070 /NCGR_PEP_ID=MMETSP0448-20130528/185982_1 /TAXON_ID=66468 /ORGANISM="Heterocapsa triquestra, Strain CCMP 448" /LENGTH=100 /DNA_ID=CAMNT_0040197869 /DNA_START=311 /DNA_END=613 /DNA_ORIENTATION=+